jgi:hypothetical protein
MISTLYVIMSLLLSLVTGVRVLEAPGVRVSTSQAATYALAATIHGLERGIDPWELVALARNESDFVPNLLGPDGKDCGIAQTRTTVSRFTCKQLRRSPWLSFAEAARELQEFKQSCKKHEDFDRCRLNRYNSGYRYAKKGVHGSYWLRVQCFAETAKAGLRTGQACRQVKSKRDIKRLIALWSPVDAKSGTRHARADRSRPTRPVDRPDQLD